LKVAKIEDDQNDKINVVYSYNYEVDEIQFSDVVEIQIQLAETKSNELLLRF